VDGGKMKAIKKKDILSSHPKETIGFNFMLIRNTHLWCNWNVSIEQEI
jgi:hypothetical protein